MLCAGLVTRLVLDEFIAEDANAVAREHGQDFAIALVLRDHDAVRVIRRRTASLASGRLGLIQSRENASMRTGSMRCSVVSLGPGFETRGLAPKNSLRLPTRGPSRGVYPRRPRLPRGCA